jgi:hypothetical protein
MKAAGGSRRRWRSARLGVAIAAGGDLLNRRWLLPQVAICLEPWVAIAAGYYRRWRSAPEPQVYRRWRSVSIIYIWVG